MDLSVGWAYAEVIVGGELGDHVDGCFGGGAQLREELLGFWGGRRRRGNEHLGSLGCFAFSGSLTSCTAQLELHKKGSTSDQRMEDSHNVPWAF
jgi:hypothetical protein